MPLTRIRPAGSTAAEERTIGRLSRATILSILLHLIILGVLLWLLHRSSVTPKAINRSKITLDLTQFQTLPPKAPGAKAAPKIPPIPKPRPKPLPKPKPPSPPLPTPQAPTNPQALKAAQPQAKPSKQSRNIDRKNPMIADTNITQPDEKSKAGKKVIVIKMTPKHRKRQKRIEKRKIVRKIPKTKQRIQRPAPPRRVVKAHARQKTPQRKKIPRRASRPTPKGPDGRLIRRLYGNSYSRMSSAQRRFIDENLRQIIRISQRTLNYLGYPREAARFGEQGTNVVEFWLHPNGDISGLRLRRRLRSSSLNRQTIEVIKTAYMHYPRPRVKTKIIIYVRYRLY